jgi:hypothetical protein
MRATSRSATSHLRDLRSVDARRTVRTVGRAAVVTDATAPPIVKVFGRKQPVAHPRC